MVRILPAPAGIETVDLQDVITDVVILLFDVEYARERVRDGSGVVCKGILALAFVKLQADLAELQQGLSPHFLIV